MKLAAASLIVLVGTLAPVPAQAAWPLWGWYGYGVPFAPPTDYMPRPPYYALYPPVYYSPLRTVRPYGASPFAWYPGMPTRGTPMVLPGPATPPPSPQWIENPFVLRKQGASSTKPHEHNVKGVAPHLALIENPYARAATR